MQPLVVRSPYDRSAVGEVALADERALEAASERATHYTEPRLLVLGTG